MLLFRGPWRLNGAELTLANGKTYRMEERSVTGEDDFPISPSLHTAEKGDILLSLIRDEEFGFYVRGYSYPGIPTAEELFRKTWELDGHAFAFDEFMYENGRLLQTVCGRDAQILQASCIVDHDQFPQCD